MLVTEINPNDELWLSKVEAPQIITDANLFAWDDEADLVVAGLGGAGIAAANEALDQSLTVIGIDKTSGGGGAGGYSGMGGHGCSNDTAAPVQGSDGQGGGGGGGYAIQDFGQFSQGAFDTTHGGGGGVGIYGEGTSGVKGTNSSGNRGGKGGSAGANGIECLSYQGNSAPGSYGTGSGGQFGDTCFRDRSKKFKNSL